MKSPEVTVIIENGLLRAAIRHLISNYFTAESVLFHGSVSDCLNGKINPSFLIIDSAVIPSPHAYTLEKIKQKNKKVLILLIESTTIDENAKPYLFDTISKTDNEQINNNKIKSFFNAGDTKISSHETLSDREKEIVELVAKGHTNKEIADSLFISPHTVITHRKNITSKLGIKTIAGLTIYALLNGIIDANDVTD